MSVDENATLSSSVAFFMRRHRSLMASQIHILRHGRSALPFPKRWITPAEFREWIAIYNRTGVAEDSRPPAALVPLLEGISAVACSDYPRSIESAARLAPRRPPRILQRSFAKLDRPWQGNSKIRLPLKVWDWISVRLWMANLISGDESIHAARGRAQEATRELISLAQEFSRVLFVGHGMLNAMIGRELRRLGWQGPKRVNDDYWGAVSFHKDS